MKSKRLSIAALLCGAALLLTAGCEDFSYPGERPGNYKPVANKTLSVDLNGMDTLRVPPGGADTTFNVHCNAYWSIKGLVPFVDEETGETGEVQISWITAPVNVFEGDGTINIKVAPNMGKRARIADICFYTADPNVTQRVPVKQEFDPSLIKPIELTFHFTDNTVMNWPTANSTTEVTYPLNGVEYSFALGATRFGGKYLVINSAGSYLGTPVIDDYKLTRLTVHVSSNNKAARHGQVSSDPAGTQIVGDYQQWPAKPSIDVVYDLHDTKYGERYYLYCVKGGLPVAGVTLKYEP